MAHDINSLLDDGSIGLDLAAETKDEAILELVGLLSAGGAVVDRDAFLAAVVAREAQSTTGLGDGIAIPHGKSDGVKAPALAFARSSKGIDWGSPDGTPAHVIFLIGVPTAEAGDTHLVILSKLARALVRDGFRQSLSDATDIAGIRAALGTIG